MKHKVIQTNLVLHHGEKNNSSNPFSYQENSSRQRTKRLKTLVSSSLRPWRSSTFFNQYINSQKRLRLAGIISCILLLALTTFAIHPISAETSSAEATANPSTTTLTVETSDNTATLDITPTSPTGTFSSSDTSGTSLAFNVSTNNITGYNLSISHESATTPAPLRSEDLSEDLDSLPTGTSISDSEFSNSTYVGYYGYKPSMLNSSSNSNYIPAPTTTSTTLNETKCANNTTSCNTTSDNYAITLGANIDYTKPAGTYTNTFILTAVANNVAYTINYLDNTGTGGTTGTDVSNLPDPESSSTATATNFTLSSTIPTRTGYTFAGWCYGTVTHNATGNDTCTTSSASGSSAAGDGVTYQPDSTFSFANYTTSTNVANLYAMWNVKTYSLAVTFAGTGVSSVQVRTASGTGGTLMGTVSTSGDSVAGLTYGVSYYLYPSYSTGYTLSSWAKTDSATNSSLSSTSAANPTYRIGAGDGAVTITGKAQSYTCTKQYRLQNADGTYPSSYTADGTSSIAYGSTCSYTKSANYYTTQSTSCTMGTSGCTLSLDLPRTTYTLTVNRNTSYISSVSGAGTYRWGQVVSISATPNTSSAFNGWSVSSGSTGSFGNASSASTTYTMPQGASTIYANGKANTHSLAITFAGSVTVTKTSATANINQSTGVASSVYANNLATKDTVTVPGASELTIELNYSMEQNYDYLYIFKGTYTGDVTKNMSAGQLYTYNTASGSSGQYDTYNTATITVPGDTVTFAFYSDSSQAYYGYYARVTGNSNVSSVSNVKVCKTAGDCTGTDLMGTVSASGGSVSGLAYNTAYYLYPTFSSDYTLDSWSKTSSTGTLSSTTSTNPTFTMGAGNGAVTVTGKRSCQTTISGTMQDFNPCSTIATGTTGTLKDSRDNQSYLVGKLADDKWWLLDNLRLGSATLVQTLSTSNTNMSSSVPFTLPASSSSDFGSYTTPMINTSYANTTTTGYGSGSKKIGVYYNYCAASAGTYCMESGSGSGNASYDVCPAGWRMPTGDSSGEYKALYFAYWDYTNYRNALSTPLSGRFRNSSADSQGSTGAFWSSTYGDTIHMYYLSVNSSDADFGYYYFRSYGISVRCILK